MAVRINPLLRGRFRLVPSLFPPPLVPPRLASPRLPPSRRAFFLSLRRSTAPRFRPRGRKAATRRGGNEFIIRNAVVRRRNRDTAKVPRSLTSCGSMRRDKRRTRQVAARKFRQLSRNWRDRLINNAHKLGTKSSANLSADFCSIIRPRAVRDDDFVALVFVRLSSFSYSLSVFCISLNLT